MQKPDPDVYIDQSAEELRLNVVGGPLDLTQFTVLSSDAIAGARLQLCAGIIGASHVFALRHEALPELHEVLACGELEPTRVPARRLYSGRVGELSGPLECAPATGLAYRFDSRVLRAKDGRDELQALERRVARAAPRRDEIGLAYRFPVARQAPGSPPPQTVVWVGVQPGEREIHVETAHCYPNEQAIVFSQSRIEIEGGSLP